MAGTTTSSGGTGPDGPGGRSPVTGSPLTGLPSVTLALVNYNGRAHLGPCLDAIAALDYPRDLLEVVCVDNASTDGSRELLASRYPWVKVLAQDTNLGFSPAVNLAAELGTGTLLALVNNDMRVEPGWLRALVAGFDRTTGHVCVAGTILNWEGTRLDFGDAAVNFHGFGAQPGHDLPIAEARIVDGAELPFACGGAMLIDRRLFCDLGGFDPGFFAYFEDVDLGWRLQVCGYRTRLAAGARSYHRHHGTSSRFRMHERILLLERNALRMLIKNLDDEHLPRLLAAALLLAPVRADHDARSDRRAFDVGQGADELHTVHRLATARMHAVADVVADLPGLLALRRSVQSRRQVPDRAVLATFGDPFRPLGNDSPPYVEAMGRVAELLRIGELFTDLPVTRLVVVSASDVIGPRMAGTAIRAWEIACALGQHVQVTLASPVPVGRTHPAVDVCHFTHEDQLRALVEGADAVVIFGFDLVRYPFLATTRALTIVDLYDPWIFGSLEQYDTMTLAEAERQKRHEIDTLNALVDCGDLFICASERQRDFWTGMLASRGRLDKTAHEQHPTLRSLIDVVPFGVPDEPPSPGPAPVLTGGGFPGLGPDSKVVLWGGGTWDWFDPIGTLDAFLQVQRRVPEARLFFMGLELEGRGVPEMSTTRRLVARIRDERLVERGLVAVGPWVPYDERGRFLLEARVGVVAAKDLAESRLAFRTRMLDHFWAGLPTLATSGDVLADLVDGRGAGLVVAPNDVDALAAAMERLLTDDALWASASASARELADAFRWSKVVEPVTAMLLNPGPWRAARAARLGARAVGSPLSPGHPAGVTPPPSAAVLAERDALRAEVDRLTRRLGTIEGPTAAAPVDAPDRGGPGGAGVDGGPPDAGVAVAGPAGSARAGAPPGGSGAVRGLLRRVLGGSR